MAAQIVVRNTFLLIALFWTSSVTFRIAEAQSWNIERELTNKCFVVSRLTHSPPTAANCRSQSNGIGSHAALDAIARKVIRGIALSVRAPGSVARGKESSVDLTVFISKNIDGQLANEDSYWQYYTHCDRWNVVFGQPITNPIFNKVDCKTGSNNIASRLIVDAYESIATTARKSFRTVRQLEFLFVENLSLVNNFVHSNVAARQSIAKKTVNNSADEITSSVFSANADSRFLDNLFGISLIYDSPLINLALNLRSICLDRIHRVGTVVKTYVGNW